MTKSKNFTHLPDIYLGIQQLRDLQWHLESTKQKKRNKINIYVLQN